MTKKRTRKAGLPPGTLLYTGEPPSRDAKMTVVRYGEALFEETEAKTAEECLPVIESGAVTWVDVDGVHQVEVVRKLGECFGLHPLVAEDIVNTDQRPKIEDYGEYLFIVLKMLYRDERSWIRSEQVSIVLGRSFIISFHEGKTASLALAIRDRIRNDRGRFRKAGADLLVHALLDAIVDHYFVVMEEAGEQIESLEDHLVAGPKQTTLRSLHLYKRKLIFLRRSVWPLREVLAALERGDSPLIGGPARTYLRDVYDHTIQVIDTIEAYRDIMAGMLDIYLTSVNNRMNEIMKVLTIIATIFMPLSFVVGLYGMNFRHMPELEWSWGYPTVLGILGLIAAAMLLFFRRKKWI